uniref:Uncharacterized protein n=1 Tax=Arundo donax TaxID=35708 RepID=A0A0A9C365_ARUDO
MAGPDGTFVSGSILRLGSGLIMCPSSKLKCHFRTRTYILYKSFSIIFRTRIYNCTKST